MSNKDTQFKPGHIPWCQGKVKEDFPQLSNSGRKRGSVPWNKGKKMNLRYREIMRKAQKGS